MFNCSLCRAQCEEWVVPPYTHCSKCEQIRRIISLYNVDKVLTTLRFVYLRDEYDKISNRENADAKKIDEENEKKNCVMQLRSDKKK